MNRNKGADVAPVLEEQYRGLGMRFVGGDRNYVVVYVRHNHDGKLVTEPQLSFMRSLRIFWKSSAGIGTLGRREASNLIRISQEYRNINFLVYYG